MPCGAAGMRTRSWGGQAAPGNKRGPQSEAGGTPLEPGGLSQKQERTPTPSLEMLQSEAGPSHPPEPPSEAGEDPLPPQSLETPQSEA